MRSNISPRAHWLVAPVLLAAAATAGACTGNIDDGGGIVKTTHPDEAGSVTVSAVQWNVDQSDPGVVSVVAETSGDTVVYSDKGALVFAGGALSSTDDTVTAWKSAATVIPAPDTTESWLVAPGNDGHVYRLRSLKTLEDVSDRYGLGDATVSSIAAGSGAWVVFGLSDGIAVADGQNVTRFDGAVTGLSAFGARTAGILEDGAVRVIDLKALTAVSYKAPGAANTVFDANGELWVQTDHKIFKEVSTKAGGDLESVYDDETLTLHGLAYGGGNVWFAAGTAELGVINADKVSLAKLDVPADAMLFGSPSGDVWTLSQGSLARYGVPVSGDEADWRTNVLPVYARVCSQCHAPGGSSGIDLSTYPSWQSRRALIYQRVLVAKDMPQGQVISDDDSMAIATWTQAMP